MCEASWGLAAICNAADFQSQNLIPMVSRVRSRLSHYTAFIRPNKPINTKWLINVIIDNPTNFKDGSLIDQSSLSKLIHKTAIYINSENVHIDVDDR